MARVKGKAAQQNDKAKHDDGFLEEVEKTGKILLDEVKQLFDSLSDRVAGLAGTAAEATMTVAEKVTKEPGELLKVVVSEVREAGEVSLQAIGDSFDLLKEKVVGSPPTAAPRKKRAQKKTARKSAGKKKAAVKRRATTQKKVAVKGRPVAKKKALTSKKRVSVKKKAASKKKVAAKKQTARKKKVARRAG